jgi:hypothetical protein
MRLARRSSRRKRMLGKLEPRHRTEPYGEQAGVIREASKTGSSVPAAPLPFLTDAVRRYSRDYASKPMDVQGFKVEALDGDIGKVDEATYDVGSSCIVVDTGPWIFGRKVVLPAGTIERIDLDGERVAVRLTKDQIKNAPELDEVTDYRSDEYRPASATTTAPWSDPTGQQYRDGWRAACGRPFAVV